MSPALVAQRPESNQYGGKYVSSEEAHQLPEGDSPVQWKHPLSVYRNGGLSHHR